MKATELRIGNLFNPDAPVKVDAWMLLPESKVVFKPIHLTEEWMLRFIGVEQLSPIKFRYKLKLFFLRDNVICDYVTGIKLEFVHEFQNFIHAVMKEELNLKP